MVATIAIAWTGSFSRCRRKTSTSRSPSSWGIDISCRLVMPADAASPAAASWSSSMRCSDREPASQRPSRAFADRVTRPVGFPSPSRSNPSASCTWAKVSAEEFASATCPSTLRITSGLPVTASISSSVGWSGRSHRVSSNPCRRITGSSSPAARPAASAKSSPFERAATTSWLDIERPAAVRCTCVSMNPGRIVIPGSSTVRSAAGGSPPPTRCTCRPSINSHSPVGG